ncbi:MAG: oxidoreductase [Calditrichaeota bacterium]|nr:oxidoreductase [Calditrichota bacterium]MCB9391396.1 oxidoreductase [Calditrichota bacterium]
MSSLVENIQVEPRKGPKYNFFDVEVVRVAAVTPTVKLFDLRVPNRDAYTFKAGQFIQLDFPQIPAKVTRRSYSIASAPEGTNELQLCVGRVPDGLATRILFEDIQPGMHLKGSEAIGHFVLPPVVEKEICFISTGVGIAPFRSMLLDGYKRGTIQAPVSLFFGNRHESDILYREDFEKMAAEHDLKFFPVLSREHDWQGPKGHVHVHYMEHFKDRRPATFYLCGWRNMLNEARGFLSEMGYDRNDIKIELYD